MIRLHTSPLNVSSKKSTKIPVHSPALNYLFSPDDEPPTLRAAIPSHGHPTQYAMLMVVMSTRVEDQLFEHPQGPQTDVTLIYVFFRQYPEIVIVLQ